ncbi:SMC family ATPase [archaeon]|nr:MAG: SMC family ATPase [archaeon]
MISKVRLTNWRSHANSELIFSSGTNALLGNMGAGKTSILDAICFSLFGTCPNLQSKKLKLDEMIMKKPIERDKAEVEVHFQVDNNVYSVKRVIEKGRGTTYSELRENGKLLEAPSTQRVNELVSKVMKVDYDLFSKAIYSEQNALDYFLTIPRGQRMKKIDELLMIDKFEKVRSNVTSLVNRIAEKKVGKESVIEHMDLEKTQRNIAELLASINTMTEQRQSLLNELGTVSADKSRMEKEIVRLSEIRKQLEIIKRQESGLSSAINETNRTLTNLQNLENMSSKNVEKNVNELKRLAKSFEEMLTEKNKSYLKLQEQNAKIQSEITLIEKEKLSKLEKELKEKARIKAEFDGFKSEINISTKLKEKQELMQSIISEVEASKARLQDLSDSIEQLSVIGGKCPICEAKLSAVKKKMLIKQKRMRIGALKSHIEDLAKRKKINEKEFSDLIDAARKLDLMAKDLENFDAIRSELENTKNIYSVLNDNGKKIAKELEAVRNDIESLKEKYKGATNESQKADMVFYKLLDYEEKKARLSSLVAEREAMMKHVAEIENVFQGVEFERQEKMFTELAAREKELAAKASGLTDLIKEKTARLQELQGLVENAAKEKEYIAKLDNISMELKIFAKALEETQLELRKEFIAAVNFTMSEMWTALYPYQDFTGAKLAVDEGDYVLQLQEKSGRFMNVEGVVSGGERSIAALALRIAFSLVLAPNVRVLILDEPTANLDANAINMLAMTLRERINDFIDQCFLITHQSEMEEAITGVGYILERDKKNDGETRIEQIF